MYACGGRRLASHVADRCLLRVHHLDVMLCELCNPQLCVPPHVPLRRLYLACEQLEERGLAGAVWSDDGDARLAVEAEVALAVERRGGDGAVGEGVCERRVRDRDARWRQGGGGGEVELQVAVR